MARQFPFSGNLCSLPSSSKKSAKSVVFSWVEINVDLDNIDISDFLHTSSGVINSESDVNVEYMLEKVKESLIVNERKTSKWQNMAILHSLNTD